MTDWVVASDGTTLYIEPANDQDYIEDDYIEEGYYSNEGSWAVASPGSASWGTAPDGTTAWSAASSGTTVWP